MKKCPFCAEEIQDEANKCRFCGEWINKDKGGDGVVIVNNKKKISFENFFEGRIGKQHYIKGLILLIIICIFLFIVLDNLFNGVISQDSIVFIIILFFLFSFISLGVRRLHDIGESGKRLYWAIPACVFPFILIFVLPVIFYDGDDKSNKYGKKPADDASFLDAILNRIID